MKYTEPVTHLFLIDSPDGHHEYEVVLPVRIAEEIGLRPDASLGEPVGQGFSYTGTPQ